MRRGGVVVALAGLGVDLWRDGDRAIRWALREHADRTWIRFADIDGFAWWFEFSALSSPPGHELRTSPSISPCSCGLSTPY
jgi:hypothetical protein